MNFYSYNYLYQQNKSPNYFTIIIAAVLILALVITFIQYSRNRKDNKYRDLLVIFVLSIMLLLGINYNNYEKQVSTNSQTNQTLLLMKSIAKTKHISYQKLYSSSGELAEGMLIKDGKNIYRVNFDNNFSSYTLQSASVVDVDNINLIK